MSDQRNEIRQWLAERNYTPGDIEKILSKLDEFDKRTSRSSLFDDLTSGAFDLGPIIREALGDQPSS